MARPSKFTAADILDSAALVVVDRWRDATIDDVARRLGAPIGSIYYRFASREELFVSLWLRAVQRFQVGLLAALRNPDAHGAALAAAVHVPRFCAANPDDASVLTLYRWRDLCESAPATLADQVARVNDPLIEAMRDLTLRLYGVCDDSHLAIVRTACQECPYGLVRRYLGGAVPEPFPSWLEAAVSASASAILAVGLANGSATGA